MGTAFLLRRRPVLEGVVNFIGGHSHNLPSSPRPNRHSRESRNPGISPKSDIAGIGTSGSPTRMKDCNRGHSHNLPSFPRPNRHSRESGNPPPSPKHHSHAPTVIPAKAGIQESPHSSVGIPPSPTVIPAKAGIHLLRPTAIPAPQPVIPAKAGIQESSPNATFRGLALPAPRIA